MTTATPNNVFYWMLERIAAGLFVVLVFTGWMALMVATEVMTKGEAELEQQIIDRGLGLHCPTTGKFAFSGECK